MKEIEKKYELIPSDKEGLYRIKALKCFGCVMIGEIGGYVECESNLSQYDDCWIYDDAIVRDYAQVCHNAVVRGCARVYGEAQIYDNAVIDDDAQVYGNTIVFGSARIYDEAIVRDNARVFDNAFVYGEAEVCGHAEVRDRTTVQGIAVVQGDAVVMGNADICGDAIISSDRDYIVFKNWWSSGRYFTWTRSNNMWKVGCFYGSGEELIAKAYEDSEESGREYECIVKYVERILNTEESKTNK